MDAKKDGKKEYVVTALAGPKVAGVAATEGQTLSLTEPEARSELLAGALAHKGEAPAKGADVFKTTGAIADIRARATGADKAPKDEKEAAREAAKPADTAAGKPPAETGDKPAAGAASKPA